MLISPSRAYPNMFDAHPPFQIDGNFGGTAGVAEMLMQSHEGYIDLLPALPSAWRTGSFRGLLARGNIEVGAQWTDSLLRQVDVLANIGGPVRLHYPGIGLAVVTDGEGRRVAAVSGERDLIEFAGVAGKRYRIAGIPAFSTVAAPGTLSASLRANGEVVLKWGKSPQAVSYKVYSHSKDQPDYRLLASGVTDTSYVHVPGELKAEGRVLFRVTAVDANGRESVGMRAVVEAP
jgi:hypothetical protein